MPDIFISYRREESTWPARTLKAWLAQEFGEESVFMDLDSIGAGQDWPRRIEGAIESCSVALILIGQRWLSVSKADGTRRLDDARDWVRQEVLAALAREGMSVVPVLLDGARMPDERELPPELAPLARRNAVALTGDHWNADFKELVGAIRSGLIHHAVSQGVPPPKLVVVSGAKKRRFRVNSEMVIGRGETAEISIADDELSRRHAKVWPTPGGIRVEDLGSLNGTWLNAVRVEGDAQAADGDLITLGQTTLRVEVPLPRAAKTRLSPSPVAEDTARARVTPAE